jgi:hypothetical protein
MGEPLALPESLADAIARLKRATWEVAADRRPVDETAPEMDAAHEALEAALRAWGESLREEEWLRFAIDEFNDPARPVRECVEECIHTLRKNLAELRALAPRPPSLAVPQLTEGEQKPLISHSDSSASRPGPSDRAMPAVGSDVRALDPDLHAASCPAVASDFAPGACDCGAPDEAPRCSQEQYHRNYGCPNCNANVGVLEIEVAALRSMLAAAEDRRE